MSAFRRSNALIDHVLGTPRPENGDVWKARKGNREIRILEVDADGVDAVALKTGRRTRIRLDILIATYLRQPRGTEEIRP